VFASDRVTRATVKLAPGPASDSVGLHRQQADALPTRLARKAQAADDRDRLAGRRKADPSAEERHQVAR
jgi:hypothetical protein